MTYERESEVGPYPFVFYFFSFPYLSSSILLFTKTHTNTAASRYPRKRQRETERELTYSKGEDPSITELPEHPEEKKTRVFFFSFELLNEQSRGRERFAANHENREKECRELPTRDKSERR
jgi:hypothetical protein